MSRKQYNKDDRYADMSEEEREYLLARRRRRKQRELRRRIITLDIALAAVLGVVGVASIITRSTNAKAENPGSGIDITYENEKGSSSASSEGTDGGAAVESNEAASTTENTAAGSADRSSTTSEVASEVPVTTDLNDGEALKAASDRLSFIENSSQYKELVKNGYPMIPDTVSDSYTCLVTRKFRLPSDYIPADLTVPDVAFSFNYVADKRKMRELPAAKMAEMFNAASTEGVELIAVSGYRSYKRQTEIYMKNVSNVGADEADSVSAQPGGSEHQSGLTMDLSAESAKCDLTQAFGDTREGKWLANNCYKYGFIIRYPKGKEKITGYEYEPWHIRYVGEALATYLHDNNLCLDEYYGITAEDE